MWFGRDRRHKVREKEKDKYGKMELSVWDKILNFIK